MSSWGERVASVVTSCGPRAGMGHGGGGGQGGGIPYHRRLEKVKFGVPLEQVCKKDIPGPLLVMLLKINKEGPFKKDVFRAPGQVLDIRKLTHFLQQGRLVNIHSFSVNTIASVLKKFLRKIPGGIFGPDNEARLFEIVKLESQEEKLKEVQKVFSSLPVYSQQILVLLFGTFRVIHANSERAKTGMTAEALGVSVAPSFFHTCVAAGKTAKMEDVERFKLATKVTTFFIDHFGIRDLYGRENYEFYARLTGRILKVEDEWIFFTYPAPLSAFSHDPAYAKGSGAASDTGVGGGKVVRQLSRDDMDASLDCLGASPDVGSGSASVHGAVGLETTTGSLEIIPENCPLDPQGRLSISLDDHNVSSPSSCGSPAGAGDFRTQTLGRLPSHHRRKGPSAMEALAVTGGGGLSASNAELPLRSSGVGAASSSSSGLRPGRGDSSSGIKSYTCLPQVHQKQTERMRHRSEWFLSDPTGLVTIKCKTLQQHKRQQELEKERQQQQGTDASSASASLPPLPKSPLQPLQPSTSSSPSALLRRKPPLAVPAAQQQQQSSSPSSLCDISTQQQHFPNLPLLASSSSSPGAGATAAALPPSSSASTPSPNSVAAAAASAPANRASLPLTSSPFHSPPSGTTTPTHQQQQLRRRLSDKDKERRLVRRSSSKRKDKENGGDKGSSEGTTGSSSIGSQQSIEEVAVAAAAADAAAAASRPTLKRAESADGNGRSAAAAAAIRHHAALCRTGSQDASSPAAVAPTVAQQALQKKGSESSLTRSLPRI